MDWVETTGRTVDDAKEAALDQLGVDESDAEFVVVAEPKAGLFGRLKGEARVRARVMPTSPRPKRGRSRSSRDQRRGGGQGRSADKSTVAVVERSDPNDGATTAAGGGSSSGPARNGSSGASGNSRRRRGSRGGRGSGNRPSATTPAEDKSQPGEQKTGSRAKAGSRQGSSNGRRPQAAAGAKEEAVGEVLSLEEQGDCAREFIEGLVGELGLRADVSVKVIDEDTAEVAVDGPELGILIGPAGATLGALQELARTVVQRRTGGHSDRILVDVAGYRAKRSAALQKFTKQVVEEVRAEGTERALEPMSAADRKVVHDTVNEIDGISTRSEGEEPRRYIVISVDRNSDD